jgi:hypothetical protein
VFGKKIDILTQDACLFYNNQAVYENFGGIVLAAEEGEEIAACLGPKNKTCILQNHGLLTCKSYRHPVGCVGPKAGGFG